MLIVQNITKKFGFITALKDVSFKTKSGEIVALLGKNGAGKSTLLKIISGYIEPDEGEVSLDGVSLHKDRTAFAEKISYVPENTAIYPDMSVYEFLNFTAEIRCHVRQQVSRRISEVCKLLNLSGVLSQKCGSLSKGFKKRVSIAAALLANSSLLLFDEPTEGLDPAQKNELHKILKKLSKNHHIIISTHLMEDVEALADKIVFIDQGAVLGNMSLEEFKKISKTNLIDSFNLVTKG